MGTLFNQLPRKRRYVEPKNIQDTIQAWKKIAAAENVSLSEVIEVAKILEMDRHTDIDIDDNDAKDEQLAGFGELWESTNNLLRELLDAIATKKT